MQRGLSLGALHIRLAGGQFLARGGIQATKNVNLVPFFGGGQQQWLWGVLHYNHRESRSCWVCWTCTGVRCWRDSTSFRMVSSFSPSKGCAALFFGNNPPSSLPLCCCSQDGGWTLAFWSRSVKHSRGLRGIFVGAASIDRGGPLQECNTTPHLTPTPLNARV